MDEDQVRERFERMWERRNRVMDVIARKERRRDQEAIFRTLMDSKGDKNNGRANKQTISKAS